VPFAIELGAIVKDKITGLKGVVVARSEFIHGCARYSVQPQDLHEGRPVDVVGFDEAQLEDTGKVADVGQVKEKKKKDKDPGGPGGKEPKSREVRLR